MNKRYDTLLWDLDGTLLDFKMSERYALRVCLEPYGIEMTEEAIAMYSAINDSYWKKLELGLVKKADLLVARFRDFFERAGITNVDPEAVQNRYQRELGTMTYFRDDADKLIPRLKKLGFGQYVVTNGVKITQDIKMKNSGFDQVMDGIFISEEIGFEKPNIEYFERALPQIPNFQKSRALLIGDSLSSDIKGAIAAGIDSCWYNPERKQAPDGWNITYDIASLQELEKILILEDA